MLVRETEELRNRNSSVEDELKDVQQMLTDQQKIYSSHIKELRSQLHDLEEATKGKYEEQLMSLQLEIKLKNDQIQKSALDREQLERKLRQKLDELSSQNHHAQREISEKEDHRDELGRLIKNQEFEIEKLRRIMHTKEEEYEGERRRFIQKWEKKVDEQDKERQEWAEMYQGMQREIIQAKFQSNDRDGTLQMTLKQRTMGEDNFGNLSFKGSPERVGNSARLPNPDMMIFNQGGSGEVQEMLKTKEEEIKILWNVIKEINKSKGSEKVSMEQLQQVITSSKLRQSNH